MTFEVRGEEYLFKLVYECLPCKGFHGASAHGCDPNCLQASESVTVGHVDKQNRAFQGGIQSWMARNDFHTISIDRRYETRHRVDVDVTREVHPGLRWKIGLRLTLERRLNPLNTFRGGNAKIRNLLFSYDFHCILVSNCNIVQL